MAWERVALLLAAERCPAHLDEMAATLGLVRKPAGRKVEPEKPRNTSLPRHRQLPSLDTPSVPAASPRARFWQIQSITRFRKALPARPAYIDDPDLAGSIPQGGTFIFEPPLQVVSLASLVPLLFNGLGEDFFASRLDWKKLARRIATGRPVEKIPRRRQKRWPRHLAIIRDQHRTLFSYWHDFERLVRELQALLGRESVTTFCVDELGPDALAPCPESKSAAIPPGSGVLVLSDLEDYGSMAREQAWRDLLTRLWQRGCRVIALSPAARSPADATICGLSRPHTLFQNLAQSRHPSGKGFRLPVKERDIETGLTMIAALPLVDRGLLRKLRLAFSWGNPAVEGILWNHEKVSRSYLGIRLLPKHRECYEQKFAVLDAGTRERFWRIVSQHHEKGYPGLKNLEQLRRALLAPELESMDLAYYKAILARYHQADPAEASQREALVRQIKTMLDMVPATAWIKDDATKEFLAQALGVVFSPEIQAGQWPPLPEGLRTDQVPILTQQEEKNIRCSFFQESGQGHGCIRIAADSEGPENNRAARILSLTTGSLHPATVAVRGDRRQQVLQPPCQVAPEDGPLVLVDRTARYRLKTIRRPSWAEVIGHDASGLFVEIKHGDPATRVYWLPEERTAEGERLAGVWFSSVTLPRDTDRDQYGVYWDLKIRDILYRCRWIPPGTFFMGSPEDEPERNDDETRHQVTLTRGFWMGETTVTQELWTAVMGYSEGLKGKIQSLFQKSHPSHFKGENRPVDSVSWEGCREFCKKLQALPETAGLTFDLPTEAQWEYACRAGTITPFFFGGNITPKQVNYDGNYPYHNRKMGLYRKETVEVKSLPCNDWRLYQMHGNVWEWCRDWYGDYPDGPVEDPTGPKRGDGRVLRGGSWIDGGRYCRSAYRYSTAPGLRYHYIGFRLSPGKRFR